ncbi:MAG: DUF2007 domain-containing protein [Oscillospiraceae bacterium]|nr:DUF2007 domain-containing protein [Oscillospiraceae bacterium]
MAILDWMQGKQTEGPPWPHKDDGTPVAPAFLTHLRATDMEGQIVVTMLESAEVPVVTQYPNNGSFGRVVLGFSGTGVDLYVPESMLEDARALMEHQFEEEDFDHV